MRRNPTRSLGGTIAAAGLFAAVLLGMMVAPTALTAAPAVARAAPAVPAAPAAAATDSSSDAAASQAYQTLFGAEEKRVLATATTKDDGQFANLLLEKSKSLTDDPALLQMVYAKAYEFGIKDPDGYPAAAQAMAKLGEADAMPKMQWRAKQTELAWLRLKRGNPADRVEAGNWLIDELTGEGDRLAGLHDYAEAMKRYTDAATVASQVRSPRVEEVRARVKSLQARMATRERLNKLLAQFEARPGDSKLAGQIVTGFLLELDDPAGAARLPPSVLDSEARRMVELAAKDPELLAEDECLKLARWYRQLADSAAGTAKVTALLRSAEHYEHYLKGHPKQDADRLAAAQEQDKVYAALAVLGIPAADRLVVWNTHNTFTNDRGTTLINVFLISGGGMVWAQNGLAIDWVPGKDRYLSVPLPKVPFDKVRVEIVKWHGFGGGLSEIQVLRGQRNLAAGAGVVASAAYDKRFPPSTLTDGVTTSAEDGRGYWLLPNATVGWAEVDLKAGQK